MTLLVISERDDMCHSGMSTFTTHHIENMFEEYQFTLITKTFKS